MQHIQTKVSLSKQESELVNNPGILLTKNNIIKKVYELFGEIATQYATDNYFFPAEVIQKHPKISRGENYEGLPYVMLDYPRHFLKEDTFSIRSFFWWGNFFSITIQLSHGYKTRYQSNFLRAFDEGLLDGWKIGINEDIWLHHFGDNNYSAITKRQILEQAFQQKDTIKIAKKIPLTQWDDAYNFFTGNFKLLATILKA